MSKAEIELSAEAVRRMRQAKVDQIEEAIANVTDMANKLTFPDARLLVFAQLIHTRAMLLAVERLGEVEHSIDYLSSVVENIQP